MAQKYFVTPEEVKQHTDAQQNVDNQLLEPRIPRCQEKYIKPVLGPDLYEDLDAALQAEQQEMPVTMPDHLDALLEQIVPVLAQWVFLKSLPFLTVKATNAGLKGLQDAPSDAEQRAYRKEVQEEAEDRTNDLKDWLELHKADYPNYMSTAKTARPIGGIVFD
ncbi:DUF6712 family protein [Rufibacter quisquiliarum]|uniref:Uncharacterized protein n=1 Tax=Rufibacter quisquiliarum TaxID=1549639 RepID=A0A839GMA9_9BACT|nr:DUF6712 family protein [Rufibacter quisquiliarum]MBA9076067.1 hypothetical protein [Rufibacter quisquiliarum]